MNSINWNASSMHKDMVLALLWSHMGQDMRQRLILECPAAYNDVCGMEIARVHRVSDGEPVIPGVFKTTQMVLSTEN